MTMDAAYLIIFGSIYFLPTIVALCSGHLSSLAIFVLNAVFGWTWIGWIAALIWACTGNTKRNREVSTFGRPQAINE